MSKTQLLWLQGVVGSRLEYKRENKFPPEIAPFGILIGILRLGLAGGWFRMLCRIE